MEDACLTEKVLLKEFKQLVFPISYFSQNYVLPGAQLERNDVEATTEKILGPYYADFFFFFRFSVIGRLKEELYVDKNL